jgi:hypothetical protein
MYIDNSHGVKAMSAKSAEWHRFLNMTGIANSLHVFTVSKTYHEIEASYTKLKVIV